MFLSWHPCRPVLRGAALRALDFQLEGVGSNPFELTHLPEDLRSFTPPPSPPPPLPLSPTPQPPSPSLPPLLSKPTPPLPSDWEGACCATCALVRKNCESGGKHNSQEYTRGSTSDVASGDFSRARSLGDQTQSWCLNPKQSSTARATPPHRSIEHFGVLIE